MKKLLFTALLVAGTNLVFAKDNVQNAKSTNIESSKVDNIVESQTIYQFDSLKEAQKFLAECTSVIYAYANQEVSDGNGGKKIQRILVSRCEVTSPCVGANTGITVEVITV